jgi:hypothetical protein
MLRMTTTPSIDACRFLAALLVGLALAGCGEPVPEQRSAYVGFWEGPHMKLSITREGTVSYERRKESGTVSINGPLQGFKGDSFVVGWGPVRTTFVVSRRPYRDGPDWKMVVDGVELRKRGRADEIRA